MANKNNYPEVRLAGYSEKWLEESFYKLFSGIPNNSLSRDKLNYNYGKAKNVHYGDILIKYNEILDVANNIIPYITDDDIVEKLKGSKLVDGDILLADAAEDKTVGKCIEMVNVNEEIILSGLHTIAVRPQKNFASKYLGYYLNSDAFHDQLLGLMQGTKVLSISKTSIKNTTVRYPKNKTEQAQIGNFFQNLDQLISKHEQKLTKLKNLKKAMLDKMFPKEGTTVPEIRFKGFTGDWVQVQIENLAIVSTGFPFDSKKFNSEGEFLVITNGNIQNESPFVNSSQGNRIDINDEIPRSYILNSNDILITMDGTVGRTAKVKCEKQILAQRVGRLKAKVNSNFLYYSLNTGRFFRDMNLIAIGGTIKHISLSDISSYYNFVPKNQYEQEKIGDYFKNLDALITNHTTQRTKLQNLKKACLARMFV